ncbi:MAG: sugar-binding protein [Verrucomicrobiae bacterium]|nr:sugar-binding protein [Verrucomicrobiae bacterium]
MLAEKQVPLHVVPPAPVKINPFFGLSSVVNPKKNPIRGKVLEKIGIYWDIAVAYWDISEPTKGVYNWNTWSAPLQDLREKPDRLHRWVHIRDPLPKWLKANDQSREKRIKVDTWLDYLDDFQEYVHQLVKKNHDLVKHWEILGEADSWCTPQQYVQIVNAAYQGLKRADPECKLIVGGLLGDGQNYLEQIVAGGAKFDIVSLHPYCGTQPPEKLFPHSIAKTAAYIKKLTGEPAWLNEVGWAAGTGALCVSEQEQAEYLARMYTMGLSIEDVKMISYFVFGKYQEVTNTWWGMFLMKDGNPDFSPAFFAYANLISQLSDAKYLKVISPNDIGKSTSAYIFQKNDDILAVCWRIGLGAGSASLPVNPSQITITDLYGNLLPVEGGQANGSVIPLTSAPCYVLFKNKPAAEVGRLFASIPAVANLTRKDEKDCLEFTLRPSRQTFQSLKQLEFKVKNNGNRKIEAAISLAASGWKLTPGEKENVGIPPMEEKVLTYDVSGKQRIPFHDYHFELSVKGESGWTQTKDMVLDFPLCRHTSRPVVVDGDLGEWNDAYPLNLNRKEQVMLNKDWNPTDLSAQIYTQWDEENLYFAAKVYDDKFHNDKTGDRIYCGDSIQIAFDTLNKKTKFGYGEDDYEYCFALTSKGPEVYCSFGKLIGAVRDIPLAVKVTETNPPHPWIITYEAAIPLSRLKPLRLREGQSVGFNVLIMDHDGTSGSVQKGLIQYANGIACPKDPSSFVSLLFVEEKGAEKK